MICGNFVLVNLLLQILNLFCIAITVGAPGNKYLRSLLSIGIIEKMARKIAFRMNPWDSRVIDVFGLDVS